MSNLVKLTAEIATTNPAIPLGLEVWLDNQLLEDINPVTGILNVSYDIDDDVDQPRVLRFKLKNKLPEHTKIDELGNIIEDALIKINNIKIDDIDLGYVFNKSSVYTHNFNGTGPDTSEQFCNVMGCNGEVTFNFSTPFYLWLLEHM
jgi:hypothetical protein